MVGKRIKSLRIKHGYSINELSEKAGISKSYLSYIERGIQKNPSLQILARLAKTLNTSLESLLTVEEDIVLEENLDVVWLSLFNEAIESGVTKEDFVRYLQFVKFTKEMENSKSERE